MSRSGLMSRAARRNIRVYWLMPATSAIVVYALVTAHSTVSGIAHVRDHGLSLLDTAALLGISLCGLLAIHPVLAAGFVLVDDHEIVGFTPGALGDPRLEHPPEMLQRIFSDAQEGRLRPFYWLIRYGLASTLGANAFAWHTLYLGMGLLSAALLYVILSRAGSTRLQSGL